ncbi:mRNA 3'-end-processing protein rna14 [Epicoccum nigrum]|nr:mRNA 3'-end-processing protein rna14 [Epicoccum nigrum]
MADDAELAFLRSQEQDYDPSGAWPAADDQTPAGEEEYDPASVMDTTQEPDDSEQLASMPNSTTDSPPAAEDQGENGLKTVSTETSAAPTPAKQPRTIGGFVDESEDEDEEPVAATKAAAPALLRASEAAETPQRSITNTPNNTLPTPDVQIHSAQDQGVPSVSASVAVNEPALSTAPVPVNGTTPVLDATKQAGPLTIDPARQATASVTPAPPSASLPKARLPQDRIGILNDRIQEDPRGDIEAWLGLIDEQRKRHKYDEARDVFNRFLEQFPTAGEVWVDYINFETELDELPRVEQLFGKAVPNGAYVPVFQCYIDFVRRRFNLTNDTAGKSRETIVMAYEFVLDQVGIDVDAGKLWIDYIELQKTAPGILGGTNWQDMQKMDTLRKLYQRAVSIPTGATLEIWRDYDRFEMGLNKVTGRKNLQEKSPSYMTARSAINVLDNNITRSINKTTLPRLPPAPGFDGYEDFMNQVKLWKQWIQWEKSDPLECAADDRALYNKRVLHIYKSALRSLRFWPELWYEAAEWCYENGLQTDGDKFLEDGIKANPESCLLAFRKGNQVELSTEFEEGQAGIIAKGNAVKKPYMDLLDTLYDLTAKTKKREEHSIARAREAFEAQKAADDAARAIAQSTADDADEDDEAEATRRAQEKEAAFNIQVHAISAGYNAQILTLKKTLTFAWIALMQATRRVQGKGGNNSEVPGFRGIFTEARRKGKLLSDAYVASAQIEHHCYQDPAAGKIFERGMKLFPEDEHFALEYIKHLIKLNDSTNARAVFETIVGKLTAKPENIPRTKPLFLFFHEYEAHFGELAQITKMEQRMATLFPEDPQLQRFSRRFANPIFDPTTVRPIISPRTQMKPVMPAMPNIMPSIEEAVPNVPPPIQVQEPRIASPATKIVNSPRLANLPVISNSPKRPLEDADESAPPRKLARGESPLKGAAGRRLDAARRNMAASGSTPVGLPQGPTPLPREINFLLGIIPPAHTYRETRFKPEGMVNMIRNIAAIPIPTLPGHAQAPHRWGTTPTTAQQLQSIQEKYGNPVAQVPHVGHAWPQ